MRQNLFGSFIYNSLAVAVAAGVLYPLWGILLNPVIASVVMSLSSITVIGNALQLRRFFLTQGLLLSKICLLAKFNVL